MHAIVRVAGVQARVAPGDRVYLPLMDLEVGSTTTLGDVLLVSDGTTVTLGSPVLEGVRVEAEVVAHGKDKKIKVFKKKRRKRYRLFRGHRQKYTEVRITDILGDHIPGVAKEPEAVDQDTIETQAEAVEEAAEQAEPAEEATEPVAEDPAEPAGDKEQ